MISRISLLPALFICITCTVSFAAEPDTLNVFDPAAETVRGVPVPWDHILPGDQRAYTNFSIRNDGDGPYMNIISSGTSSRLERKLPDIDVARYDTLAWAWRVNALPAAEWEMEEKQDDFALRIVLEYNLPGSGWNPLNIIRKGLFTSIFLGYPPVLRIAYVWSNNVPVDTPYQSPADSRMTIIPIESGSPFHSNWVREKRDLAADLRRLGYNPDGLRIKHIRIYSDTETIPSTAESALQYIRLVGDGNADE